jgi:hypothetical protein
VLLPQCKVGAPRLNASNQHCKGSCTLKKGAGCQGCVCVCVRCQGWLGAAVHAQVPRCNGSQWFGASSVNGPSGLDGWLVMQGGWMCCWLVQ